MMGEQRIATMLFLPLLAAGLTVLFSKRENLREASSIGGRRPVVLRLL